MSNRVPSKRKGRQAGEKTPASEPLSVPTRARKSGRLEKPPVASRGVSESKKQASTKRAPTQKRRRSSSSSPRKKVSSGIGAKSKPIFSPSKLFDFGCGVRFKLRWIDKLTTRDRLAPAPTLGTLIHAGEAAIDQDMPAETGIETAIEKLAREAMLPVIGSPLIDQFRQEALTIVNGGTIVDGRGTRKKIESYEKWRARAQQEDPFEVSFVETRLYADVGPLILAPKLDLAIDSELGLWPVERKTKATYSENKSWLTFRLHHQLLTQILALEKVTGREVAGAMVRIVPYSRQNKKDWTSSLPQPLSNARRIDPIWIRRSAHTEALFMARLEDIAIEYRERVQSNHWTATGITNGMCGLCEFNALCRGELDPKLLKPRPPDELDIEGDEEE